MDPDSVESTIEASIPLEGVETGGETQNTMMDEAGAMIEGGHLPAIHPLSENGREGRLSGTVVQLAGETGVEEVGLAVPSPTAQIVAEQLRAICTSASYSSEVETCREMRFGLRLIVIAWRDMILGGVTIRDFFRLEAVRVVDPLCQRKENVRFLAANAISMVLEDAEWGFDSVGEGGRLLPADQQPSNVTLRQIIAGVRTVNEELTAVLVADGSEDLEFDETLSDDEDDATDLEVAGVAPVVHLGAMGASVLRPPTMPRIAPQGSSSATSNDGPRRKRNVRRTDEEEAVLVQVARDNRGASYGQLTAEHNIRMRMIRQNAGQRWIDDRKEHGIRARIGELRKTYNDI